jgi:hypothetical protein
LPGLPSTQIPGGSDSQIARITSINHWHPATCHILTRKNINNINPSNNKTSLKMYRSILNLFIITEHTFNQKGIKNLRLKESPQWFKLKKRKKKPS